MSSNVVDIAVEKNSSNFSLKTNKILLNKNNLKKIPLPVKGKLRIWDAELHGLYVSLPPSAKAVAYFRYRINENQRDYKLGRLDRLSFKAIRDQAKKVAAMVELGEDPQLQRMQERQAQKDAKRKEAIDKLSTLGNFYYSYYIDYVRANLKDSEQRLKTIERNFGQWFEWPMDEITVSVVSQWRNQRMNTPVIRGKGENRKESKRRPGAVNRPIAYLRALLSVACDEAEIIRNNPLAKLKQLKEPKNPRKRFLTDEEYMRLHNALRERDDYLPVFIELGIHTGLRMSEMLTLRWDSIDFSNNTLCVESQFAKSKRRRFVPLNPQICTMLKEWKMRSQRFGPWVFTNPETGSHYVSIVRAWNSVMKASQVQDFTRQDLRRTFGSWLAERGESIYVIKNLLGHSSVDVTENHYAYLQDESQRNAVNRLVENA